jgi:hypothetical protein
VITRPDPRIDYADGAVGDLRIVCGEDVRGNRVGARKTRRLAVSTVIVINDKQRII